MANAGDMLMKLLEDYQSQQQQLKHQPATSVPCVRRSIYGAHSATTDFYRRLQSFYTDRSTTDEDRASCLLLVKSLYQLTRNDASNISPVAQRLQLRQRQRPRSTADLPQCTAEETGGALFRGGRRPHTSMTAFGGDDEESSYRRQMRNPYETSYTRDFGQPMSVVTESIRPSTTIGVTHRMPPTKRQMSETTYGEEYRVNSVLPETRAQPIYPPNGEKRNNPHPLQSFIIWQQPKNGFTCGDRTMTDDQLDSINRGGKLLSTYQSDYIETHPTGSNRGQRSTRVTFGKALSAAKEAESTTRRDFRRPPCVSARPELLVPTTRYGSNVNKQQPATGAVPDIPTGVYMHREKTTTYGCEFTARHP